MTEAERKTLSTANAVLAKELPEEISKTFCGLPLFRTGVHRCCGLLQPRF